MPFTLSHPAIVLPLATLTNHRLPLTGLIVGSMSPDFEYFLRFRLYGEYGHTLFGVWWLCLPVSLIVCYAWHEVIKEPLMSHLPISWHSKYADMMGVSWKRYFHTQPIIVIIAIVIGAYSHILWDSFTHHNGYFLQMLDWQDLIVNLYDYNIPLILPLHKALQHISTIFGALTIVIYLITYRSQKQESSTLAHSESTDILMNSATKNSIPVSMTISTMAKLKFWLVVISIAALWLALRIYSNPNLLALGHLVVNMISIGFFSLLGICILLHVKNNR